MLSFPKKKEGRVYESEKRLTEERREPKDSSDPNLQERGNDLARLGYKIDS